MYNFYNTIPENRNGWKNAYEIKMAALEHEKRRYQMTDEEISLAKPQAPARGGRKSGWVAILAAPIRLLAILLG
jgi:hypothetical protein